MHFLGSSPKPACLWEILPSRSGCVSALGCGRGLPALAHLPSHECAKALLGYHCSSSQWVSSSGEWNDAALYTEPLLGKGTWTKILRQGSLNTRGQSELPHVPCFGTSCLQTVSNSLSVWILSKDSNDHYLNILIYIYIHLKQLFWVKMAKFQVFSVSDNFGIIYILLSVLGLLLLW